MLFTVNYSLFICTLASPKVLSLDKAQKKPVLFCHVLIYSYLCTAFAKYAGASTKLLTNQTYIIDLMNQYETVFILTPVLSDVQMKEAADKYVNYLKDKGAEIISTEDWGLKALAYPIQKKTSGFYQMVEFKAEPTVIAKLELQMRRDERVLGYLTVKNEKYAAAYAEKRRNKQKEA